MATAEAPRTSEYHVKDWWPDIRWFPDMIPAVGYVINSERGRREAGQSLSDAYFPLKRLFNRDTRQQEVDLLLSMGTENWPKPASLGAAFRSNLMAARNMGFAAYHSLIIALSPLYLPKIAETAAEHLPKLPLP